MSVLPVLDVTPVVACCPPLSVQALPSDAAVQLAPLFKALSDPVRLRLLSLIASTNEVCVCDLTDAFDVTGATISHHLRVLREAGLVDCERRGTWVYYWIRGEVLNQLGGLLLAVPQGSADVAASPVWRSVGRSPRERRIRNWSYQRILMWCAAVRPVAGADRGATRRRPGEHVRPGVATGAKQPNVSGHLKLLRDAGLVVTEQRGRFTYYRLVPDALELTPTSRSVSRPGRGPSPASPETLISA